MKLNREAIRRMVDAGQMNIGARRNVSTGGGGGGVSQAWVDENYVSKEFFARLFTIHSDVVLCLQGPSSQSYGFSSSHVWM